MIFQNPNSPAKRALQLVCMVHMFFTAKRTGLIEYHLRIQCFISRFIGYDAPVFQDAKVSAFEHLVPCRANKNKFHIFPLLLL